MDSVRDLESQLFHNLWKNGKDEEVIKLCKETQEGPFQKCNIYNCTVLHKAIYMKRYDLASELLDHHVPDLNKLYEKNDWGNTVLHNAATFDKGLDITKKLLRKAPKLLLVRNKWGETAVFQACRYGIVDAFKVLADEVDAFCMKPEYDNCHFFQRDDGTTILHIAILTRNFEMALLIAGRYSYLCNKQASKNEMTPLQMLACSPTAFRSGVELGSFKELVYSSIRGRPKGGVIQKVVPSLLGLCFKGMSCFTLPILEEVKELKESHERAEQLAKILIGLDTTWKQGPKPCGELNLRISGDDNGKDEDDIELGTTRLKRTSSGSIPDAKEIPLILAAKHGCVEIVKEILDRYPQAMEYLNEDQQTFLHVAIKNRNQEVYNLIDPDEVPIRAQLRAIDIKGNSILHMVGFSSTKTEQDSKIKSPVVRLSDDLQLLEDLKRQCPSCLINHQNCNMKTADELFAEKKRGSS